MSEDPEQYMDMMAGEMMDEEAAPMMEGDMEASEIKEVFIGRVKLIDDMDLYKQSFARFENVKYMEYLTYDEAKAPYCGQEGFAISVSGPGNGSTVQIMFDDDTKLDFP